MYTTRQTQRKTRDRAASSVVGLVLLFGLVIAGAGVVFWTGMDARESMQTASEVGTAETSLQEVSSRLSSLSLKGDGAATNFDLSGKDPEDVAVRQDGEIQFTVHGLENACSGDVGLGSVVYQNDESGSVAYQAGGVFKRTGSSTSIVQSPSLEYGTRTLDGRTIETLRFPVVNVSGEVRDSGEVTAVASEADRARLSEELCLTGEDTEEIEWVQTIEITIKGSEYQEAWYRYFQDEFGADGTVRTNGDEVSVTAPLGAGVIPDQFIPHDAAIYGGMVMGSSAGEFDVQAGNPGQAEIDSYESAEGGYASTSSKDGTVLTRGDVRIRASSGTIAGTVVAEGDVTLKNSCGTGSDEYCIDGDVYHDGTLDDSGPKTLISGMTTDSANVPDLPAVAEDIEWTLDVTDDQNDNDETAAVDAESIDSGDVTLAGGVYYLQDLTVADGQTLTLDVTAGDMVLAVENDVTVNGDIEVQGSGQVRTFVGADSDHITVDDDASVTVSDGASRSYRSNALWFLCKPGCQATFQGSGSSGAEFTGVVYGPGGSSNIDLQQNSELYGALAAGTVTFDKAYFHFDRSLPTTPLDADGDGDDDIGDGGEPDGPSDGPEGMDCVEDDDGYDCSVTYDPARNALEVKQSKAAVTLLGSRIAEPEVERVPTETRAPMNVSLVIDDSGSMNLLANYGKYDPDGDKTYAHVSGANPLEGSATWSGWESVSNADYASTGRDGPPSGSDVRWDVSFQQCTLLGCWEESRETLDPGETPQIGDDDYVRKKPPAPDSVTVPAGYVYVGDDDGNGWLEDDIEDSAVYVPGETLSSDDHDYYHEVRPEGNDPYVKRIDAASGFVGAMDDSKDRISVVRFWAENDQVKVGQSPNFDAVNSTLDGETATWESSGGTPMKRALETGITEVKTSRTRDGGRDVTETVVLLTDGRPSDDSAANRQAIRDAAAAAHADGIRIYVVALGEEGDYNKPLLEAIANVDGENEDVVGKVYEVTDASNLEEKFADAADDSKKGTENIVEYKNSSTTVNVGGSPVDFGTNTNDPRDGGYPSIDVSPDLAPGDFVHFAVTTKQCEDYQTFDPAYNSTDVQEARCQETDGTAEQTTNTESTQHRIFMDGDSVPDVEATAWYMDEKYDDNSVEQIVEAYDEGLTDGDRFDLPENDAIILVEVDDGDHSSTDFMVLYFDASEYDPDEGDGPGSPSDDADGGVTVGETDGTKNGYVINVDSSDVNVTSEDDVVAVSVPAAVSRPEPPGTSRSTSTGARRSTVGVRV